MFKKFLLGLLVGFCSVRYAPAQTTNGLVTGAVTDSTGASVPGAQITVINQATGISRSTTSDNSGAYIIPQLPPGVYKVTVAKPGFASVNHDNVRLQVNQSITLGFQLAVASTSESIEVTTAPPMLNTTSPTLSEVIGHEETVELPLNGREFTQLTLLTPGVAPVQNGQQNAFTVALGSGGISPSVNGQRGEQNNFTMDGILNNSVFTNVWVIAPPPDAIQEFNVQSHITDAQFSISYGANINVVTRSGTNRFHGAAWEFLRNSTLDAQTFPDTQRQPYRQNQYGLFLGGPVTIPHMYDGKNKTWFSGYWEGFRSVQSFTELSSVLTAAQIGGDFSGVLGTTQIGTDSLGRPEYANEIYDPTTSRPDPSNPGSFIRDPFPGNIIPKTQRNAASLAVLQAFYPVDANMNVPEGTLPNYRWTGRVNVLSDVFGFRLDHQITQNDTLFARFNRSNQNKLSPESLPSYTHTLRNFGQQAALGYTHIFDPRTILNFRYGYSYVNYASNDSPWGPDFNNSINFTQAAPAHDGISLGPQIGISNGYTGTSQFAIPLGPIETMDYHADLSKVISNHTVGVGAMYYHLRSYDDGWGASMNFQQNGTAQDATAGPTGYGPASFLLGVPDAYYPWLGNTGADQVVSWYGLYAQDQWQMTKKLVVTAGLRWDYVTPPNYHKIVSGLDVLTGKFFVTGAVPPYFSAANAPSGVFNPQYNGWEPRLGATYHPLDRTVVHAALAILDDHNNTLVQENQNIRLSWPTGAALNITSMDLGLPTAYLDSLPSAVSLIGGGIAPYASYGANPNNKIPYAIEYNLGVQQQLKGNMSLEVDYVGSVGRHGYIVPEANTALTPGPGPISARQPFPQYGGPFSFSWNEQPSEYNGMQVELKKSMASGLYFMASYTYSKSLDWQSDPYDNAEPNFYNLKADWGPSTYNRGQMFVFSSVYQLPMGRNKAFLSGANAFTRTVLGDWSLGGILSMNSGAPFNVFASGDVANTGGPNQRAERTGQDPYSVTGGQNSAHWLNTAAFAQPTAFTFGNERRNDLVGPPFKNVDFNLSKTFHLWESSGLQFRSEFFNAVNHTNYGNPDHGVLNGGFGQITSTVNPGRQIQFALKLSF